MYALFVQRWEAEAHAAMVATAVIRAMGGEQEVTEPHTYRQERDAWLVSEPEQVDSDKQVLLRALGLR